MAKPQNRQEFVEYCLRKLGAPVIKINVADDQLDDRIDEALKYYWDYHFDGSEKVYFKIQLSSADVLNRYISVPENIIGAINVFSASSSGSIGMFDIRYQMALNDMYTLSGQSIVPYFIMKTSLAMYEELLTGQTQIRFNRNTNRLYLDVNWDSYNAGRWLVIEAYQLVDPDVYTEVWSDRWLQRYCTALIKHQWGMNLTKYNSVQLVGGMTFNGQQILADADREIEKLEDEMLNTFSLPNSFLVG